MKRKINIMIGIFALFLMSFAYAGTNIKQSGSKETQYLFFIFAKKMTVKEVSTNPKRYELTLKKVSPQVIYFSNRPIREDGVAEMTTFVKHWQESDFKNNPPNALVQAIQMHLEKKHMQTNRFIVILKNPIYKADKKQLIFTMSPISMKDNDIPAKFKAEDTAVFIDGLCISCLGG